MLTDVVAVRTGTDAVTDVPPPRDLRRDHGAPLEEPHGDPAPVKPAAALAD
jgi:hypothetical protein